MGVAVVYKGFVYSFVSEGIAWELGDKLSIIHCLYRLALSITRPSSSFSQRKAEKKNIQQNFPQFVGIISNSHPRQFRPGV